MLDYTPHDLKCLERGAWAGGPLFLTEVFCILLVEPMKRFELTFQPEQSPHWEQTLLAHRLEQRAVLRYAVRGELHAASESCL